MNLLSWLEKQKEFPKVYWRDRQTHQASAACGALETLTEIPTLPNRLYFGGLSFSDKKKESLWKNFPSCYFFAPATFFIGKDQACPEASSSPKLIKRIDLPNKDAWIKRVINALGKIERKEMEKVVLARQTTLQYDILLNPFDIMRRLQLKAKNATLFLFQPSPETTFLGASPEKLYERRDSAIFTEALAGTFPIEEKGLLESHKDQREFAYVKQFIDVALSPLCTTHSWEAKDRVIATTGVQHLYNRFTGSLKTICDNQLIRLLHPTPAMAGAPRIAALAHLNEEEPFDRGWYAAPLGWIGPDYAEIAVGIRSALVRGKEMHLFSGTGVVKGSKPEQEWEELNLKMRTFI